MESKEDKTDRGNSKIYGTSIFAEVRDGVILPLKKDTDDKVVIGYTSQGLPFCIIVDGFFGGGEESRSQIFEFIDNHVTPLMDPGIHAGTT